MSVHALQGQLPFDEPSLALASARTEEDVKDAYIKALGLKGAFKGLVDIQTEEIWFEAKEVSTPPIVMFGQLLVYVRAARKRGEPIPGFLAVIDRDKAAIMPTEHALPIFEDAAIVWPKSGSAAGKELAAQIAPYVETHYVVYDIARNAKEFIDAVGSAIKEGRIIRTQITPDNLRQVFDKWLDMVGSELGAVNPADYAVLFFADIMHDGANTAITNLPARLLYDGGKPVFLLNGQTYELASERGYRNFWAIYHRPPKQNTGTICWSGATACCRLTSRSSRVLITLRCTSSIKPMNSWSPRWGRTGSSAISSGTCAAASAIWRSSTATIGTCSCRRWIRPISTS